MQAVYSGLNQLWPRDVQKAQGRDILIPRSQSSRFSAHTDEFRSYSFQNVPSTLVASTTQFVGLLPRGTVKRLNGAVLKIVGSVSSSSAVLAPTPFWFQRIDIGQQGESQPFQSFVPEQLLINNIAGLSGNQLKQMCKNLNIRPDTYGPAPSLPSGSNFTFYLPLVGACWEQQSASYGSGGADLRFVFSPYGDVRISGSGTVAISELSIIFDHEDVHSSLDDKYASLVKTGKTIGRSRYLDVTPLSFTGQTITAGADNRFSLVSLDGVYCALLLGLRSASATNSSNGLYNYSCIQEGTIDITDSNGQSVYGGGTAVPLKYLANVVHPDLLNNDFLQDRQLYVIPFCKDLVQAIRGVVDGAMVFKKEQYNLILRPSAGTAGVFTYTFSGSPNAGTFRLSFRGYKTQPLAYNASGATIKTALEALPSLQSYRGQQITVTVSGAMGNGTTITISPRLDFGDDLIQVEDSTLNASGTMDATNGSVSLTTVGVDGQAGATITADVFVFGLRYKELYDLGSKFQASDVSI